VGSDSDECCDKAKNQHEGHRESVSHSSVDMGRPCGKNGSDQATSINVGRENRQKENWVTEDPVGRHAQVCSGRAMIYEYPRTEANGIDPHIIFKINVRNPTHIRRKWLNLCM